MSGLGRQHSRSYVEVSAGGRGVKGEPALVVGLVDAGAVLHQESHHVDVVVDARLRGETRERWNVRMSSRRCDSWCYSYRKEPCNAADRLPCGFGAVGNFGSRSDP